VSIATESTPAYGRRLVEQARRLDTHPNTLIRHVRSGVRLRDGSRLRLRATVTPGGYRIADSDVDLFYTALTADRLGASQPAVPPPSSKAHQAADAALAAACW
jgi:hypothetical protein